jgi:signal transduction histidine kinase
MKSNCIFIVEDEALFAEELENRLKSMGFGVSGTAASGEAALRRIEAQKPDLVLMDMALKGGMSGIEAAGKIKDHFEIPVVYVSAKADDEIFQKARLCEPFGYIRKPLKERDLANTIDIALYKHKIEMKTKMELKRIQNEKLASIGFLVSGVAHEINNPNNFISFNIPILKEYLMDLLPIVDEYAQAHGDFEPSGMTYAEFREDLFKILLNIEHGSKRIHRTVSQLQEFSRKKEKAAAVPIDIKDVFEKAVSVSRSKVEHAVKHLRVKVSQNMPPIHSDPNVIEQIVTNLLINAAQAADKKDAWVEIRARLGDRPQGRFIIEVKDNGSGMSRETKAKVFEPFFTTKPRGEGIGLGLALCQNLASGLKGKMEVESEPGKGSLFRLVLPEKEKTKIP